MNQHEGEWVPVRSVDELREGVTVKLVDCCAYVDGLECGRTHVATLLKRAKPTKDYAEMGVVAFHVTPTNCLTYPYPWYILGVDRLFRLADRTDQDAEERRDERVARGVSDVLGSSTHFPGMDAAGVTPGRPRVTVWEPIK